MKRFIGFEHGMGIGGWLTNYKRFNCIPVEKRYDLTIRDFEHFDSFITESDVKYIASLGMDHIRLGFDQIVVEEKPYCYREHIFELIENFVSWCEKYNINVVLNLHKAIGNYCDIYEKVGLLDDDELQNRLVALWNQFEKRFSGKNAVVFELLNEVRDVESNKWNLLAERIIREIRKVNNNRLIVVGSTCGNAVFTLKNLKIFEDENAVYTFHVYDPYEFTH